MNEWSSLPENPINPEKLKALGDAANGGPVLILTHENPDPDALASGKALAFLFQTVWELPVRLIYSGLVGRADNKAMLTNLTPEWEYVEKLPNLGDYSSVALVDTQPAAGNNNLPVDFIPHIVIDHHHPIRRSLNKVNFVDVRTEIGASVSIVYQYLDSANIKVDGVLATAIFYGIQTDTRGLSRGASLVDQTIYINTLRLIDHKLLNKVQQAGLSRDYFRAFNDGLKAACIYGSTVVADLGEIHRPDFVAEIADILIRLEGTHAALCLGYHNNVLYFSLRSEEGGEDAGLLVQRLIVTSGKAGGHGNIAGGQVPIKDKPADEISFQISKRFLQLMGEDDIGEQLLP